MSALYVRAPAAISEKKYQQKVSKKSIKFCSTRKNMQLNGHTIHHNVYGKSWHRGTGSIFGIQKMLTCLKFLRYWLTSEGYSFVSSHDLGRFVRVCGQTVPCLAAVQILWIILFALRWNAGLVVNSGSSTLGNLVSLHTPWLKPSAHTTDDSLVGKQSWKTNRASKHQQLTNRAWRNQYRMTRQTKPHKYNPILELSILIRQMFRMINWVFYHFPHAMILFFYLILFCLWYFLYACTHRTDRSHNADRKINCGRPYGRSVDRISLERAQKN